MSILVTGGAGFIGTNFILDWLSQSNELVINLDKLTYASHLANLENLGSNQHHLFVKGSIGNTELVSHLCSKYNPRAIINFAAESHVDRSIEDPNHFIQTNIVETFSLLNSAKAYWQGLRDESRANFRFLHVSTDEVYGSLAKDASPFTEESCYEPNSPYAASKAASDHLVRSYYQTYGLPVLTTHSSNNYGPYQFPEKLIPLVIQRALAGMSLPIYGDGQQIRDWLFVSDHCSAIRLVLEEGRLGHCYNIGGRNEKTNLEIVHLLCDQLDKLKPRADKQSYKMQLTFVKDRPGHDRRYAINATKLEQELGWLAAESFETGLQKTLKWYLDQYEMKAASVINNKHSSLLLEN